MISGQVVSGSFAQYVLGDELLLPGNATMFEVVGSADLLYKSFSAPLNGAHVARVRDLVDVGRQLGERSDVRGDPRRIAWPVDLIIEGRDVVGVVVPRAGQEYFRPTSAQLVPQSFSHLALSSTTPPAKPRLFVIRQLAGALVMLDRHDLVHGDISGSNMLWTLEPAPSLLLVDCDGVHPSGFPTHPFCTKYWTDPRLEARTIPRHDARSDWYALALAVYRVLVLNARAVPHAGDFDWIEAELPRPLADHLIQVFADTADADARVAPDIWKQSLRDVIEDDAQCAQIDALTRAHPPTVAGRRRARAAASSRAGSQSESRSAQPAPAPPPLTPRKPSVPSSPSGQAWPGTRPVSVGNGRSMAGHPGRRLVKRLVLMALAAVVAIMAVYHFTGLPNWPILNELNPFLNSSQRELVATLPPAVHHCVGGESPPRGALAMVQCEWGEREIVAIRFLSAGAMHEFYEKRLAIAQRKMADRARPKRCPASGAWHVRSSRHNLGEVTSFVSLAGARLDWSQTGARTYLMALSSSSDLNALCRWWTDQGFV